MKESNRVFIDADGFIALNVTNHKLYLKAVQTLNFLDEVNSELYTASYVLLEVATVINMRVKAGLGTEVIEEIMGDPQIVVIGGDKYLDAGIDKLKTQRSKNISLFDCTYFAIVEDLGINSVFSFDKHWAKNGFNLITVSGLQAV